MRFLADAAAGAAGAAGSGRIDEELLEVFLAAGSLWVLWLLLGLSLIAVAVILERLWFFGLERSQTAQLEQAIAAFRAGESGRAAASGLEGVRSLPVNVARACLDNAEEGPASVEEYAASAVDAERLRFERGLAFLGTLGNNAPFVGLFGTVLGIIRAFHDLSLNSAAGAEAVMAGIAEALVATAVGLLVALPAVAAYNAFGRHVEAQVTAAESATHAILGHIKSEAPGIGSVEGSP